MNKQIDKIETRLAEVGRSDPVSNLLSSIPGVGPITSTAIAATIPDARMFRSGREFAAWLGLTPRQNSSGGTTRLGVDYEGGRCIPALSARNRCQEHSPIPESSSEGRGSLDRRLTATTASYDRGRRHSQ
nr:transposase [Rhizobium laguerreae]